MDKTIELKLPGPSDKGFFRFLRQQAMFLSVMGSPASHSPSEVDEALDWLVSLAVMADKKAARKVIENLSADQISELLKTLSKVEPEIDPNS